MRKYIVDNLDNQTITGNIRLDGTFKVTDGTYSVSTYKALLTQMATASCNDIFDLPQNSFIIGETYTIVNYVAGDDFSNIADVISGEINQTGCEFKATGPVATNWQNGSELVSSGNLVVDVIENNLGFDIVWFDDFFFAPGVYFAFKSTTGPLYNSFPREKVIVKTQQNAFTFGPPEDLTFFSSPGGIGEKDESIVLAVWNWDVYDSVGDRLYYTPIEISFKQDLDTTPILATGSVVDEYPISYAGIDIFSNGNYIESIYADNISSSNNLSELITLLNEDINTSYLGVFSDDEMGGIQLTIQTNIKNQFSSNGTLTFEVFND